MIRVRRGTIAESTGISVDSAIVDRMKPVQTTAACRGSVHPAIKAATLAGADSERRRLSSIFQRPISGSARLPRAPVAASPRPRIHDNSCQSPRTQRCWRAAATS